jgi:hypothetical protein
MSNLIGLPGNTEMAIIRIVGPVLAIIISLAKQ